MDRRPLLDRLDESTVATMLGAGPTVRLPAEGFLVRDGDDTNSVFLVAEGLLKIVKSSPEGRVSMVGLRRRGTLLGELAVLAGATRASSMRAVEPSVMIEIGGERFERLLVDHPDLQRELLTELAGRLREATLQMHDLMNADARTRIAARLVQLADESFDVATATPTLHLPVSQDELGDWAGLSRAGVVKALRSLRNSQLIETSRMSISIKDLRELRRIATV